MIKLIKISSGVEKSFKGMINRARSQEAFLQRVIYPEYQNRQRKRWMSEGASEGQRWPALNTKYAASKLVRFASYAGAGTKMMIATGRLKDAVIGDGDQSEHRKIIQKQTLFVSWATPYAKWTEKVRPVNVWDKKQNDVMMKKARLYLLKGKI